MLACVGLALFLPTAGVGAGARPSQGGAFRIAMPAAGFDSIDPLLSALPAPSFLFRLTCASLLTYPPKAPAAGYRLVPDLALRQPRISNGGRTYTYTLATGRRFSTGAHVTVDDVAASFHRAIDPRLASRSARNFADIVGADDVLAGRARRASGIVVRPRRRQVVLRLRRARAEFLPTSATLCIFPARLPLDPEGVRAPVPGAGPYVVTSYVPGRRVVLTRNRTYSGAFRGRVDRFEVALTDLGSILGQVERGEVDWGWVPNQNIAPRAAELMRTYGSRFFVRRGLFRRMLVLNASQPLFRNNATLRRAVNFAIDRKALLRERGFRAGVLTDQYLPPGLPGFRDERIYPLGRPDIRTARRLARGRTRGGRAVFYGPQGSVGAASGEIVRRSLAPLGISVEVRLFPGEVLFRRLATRGEPFDIGWIGWLGAPDPAVSLNANFHGKGCCNWSHFDSPRYNALLRRAARLTGRARSRAYGRIDVDLARNAAPAVQYAVDNTMTFVGPRVPRRCVVLNPELDLRAVCVR